MQNYKNQTLRKYLDCLASKAPVPGGGSAAALVGSLGAALISMVAHYSLGRKSPSIDSKVKTVLLKSEKIRKRLLELVDFDAQAYLGVVKTRHAPYKMKQKALKKAREVPTEVCRLCYAAVQLTSFLVKKGNRHLISDVQVASELLEAAFHSAMINVEINQ